MSGYFDNTFIPKPDEPVFPDEQTEQQPTASLFKRVPSTNELSGILDANPSTSGPYREMAREALRQSREKAAASNHDEFVEQQKLIAKERQKAIEGGIEGMLLDYAGIIPYERLDQIRNESPVFYDKYRSDENFARYVDDIDKAGALERFVDYSTDLFKAPGIGLSNWASAVMRWKQYTTGFDREDQEFMDWLNESGDALREDVYRDAAGKLRGIHGQEGFWDTLKNVATDPVNLLNIPLLAAEQLPNVVVYMGATAAGTLAGGFTGSFTIPGVGTVSGAVLGGAAARTALTTFLETGLMVDEMVRGRESRGEPVDLDEVWLTAAPFGLINGLAESASFGLLARTLPDEMKRKLMRGNMRQAVQFVAGKGTATTAGRSAAGVFLGATAGEAATEGFQEMMNAIASEMDAGGFEDEGSFVRFMASDRLWGQVAQGAAAGGLGAGGLAGPGSVVTYRSQQKLSEEAKARQRAIANGKHELIASAAGLDMVGALNDYADQYAEVGFTTEMEDYIGEVMAKSESDTVHVDAEKMLDIVNELRNVVKEEEVSQEAPIVEENENGELVQKAGRSMSPVLADIEAALGETSIEDLELRASLNQNVGIKAKHWVTRIATHKGIRERLMPYVKMKEDHLNASEIIPTVAHIEALTEEEKQRIEKEVALETEARTDLAQRIEGEIKGTLAAAGNENITSEQVEKFVALEISNLESRAKKEGLTLEQAAEKYGFTAMVMDKYLDSSGNVQLTQLYDSVMSVVDGVATHNGITRAQMLQRVLDTKVEMRDGKVITASGATSNLNKFQAQLTRTPEFKAWFGNSKVVDENGEPKVMYHGTRASTTFSNFWTHKQMGAHFGTEPFQANERLGTYRSSRNARVAPVFLRIENPIRLHDAGIFDDIDNIKMAFSQARGNEFETDKSTGKLVVRPIPEEDINELERMFYNPDLSVPDMTPKDISKYMQTYLKSKGYDGVVYRNTGELEPITARSEDSYIVFDDDQVSGAYALPGETSLFQTDFESVNERRGEGKNYPAADYLNFEFERNPDGTYKGAPPTIKTPAQLRKYVKRIKQLMREGEREKFWYERSSEVVINMLGGNLRDIEVFVRLLAVYSPNATVEANVTFAMNALTQWKAGARRAKNWKEAKPGEFRVRMEDADDRALEVLESSTPWEGRKTNSFYMNLMHWAAKTHSDEELMSQTSLDAEDIAKIRSGDLVTADMWVFRALGYPNDAAGNDKGSGKYSFSENLLRMVAAEINDKLGPEDSVWYPHQVQAAMWAAFRLRWEDEGVKERTTKKSIRKGYTKLDEKGKPKFPKGSSPHRTLWSEEAYTLDSDAVKNAIDSYKLTDFGTILNSRVQSVAYETIPSPKTGHPLVQTIAPQGVDQRVWNLVRNNFTSDTLSIATEADGSSSLGKIMGIEMGWRTPSVGMWGGQITPNEIMNVLIGLPVGVTGELGANVKRAKVNAVSRMIQYIFMQEGVPWHRADHKLGAHKGARYRVVDSNNDTVPVTASFDNAADALAYAENVRTKFWVTYGKDTRDRESIPFHDTKEEAEAEKMRLESENKGVKFGVKKPNPNAGVAYGLPDFSVGRAVEFTFPSAIDGKTEELFAQLLTSWFGAKAGYTKTSPNTIMVQNIMEGDSHEVNGIANVGVYGTHEEFLLSMDDFAIQHENMLGFSNTDNLWIEGDYHFADWSKQGTEKEVFDAIKAYGVQASQGGWTRPSGLQSRLRDWRKDYESQLARYDGAELANRIQEARDQVAKLDELELKKTLGTALDKGLLQSEQDTAKVSTVSFVLRSIETADKEAGPASYWLTTTINKKGKEQRTGILSKPGIKQEEVDLLEVEQTLQDFIDRRGDNALIYKHELLEALRKNEIRIETTTGDREISYSGKFVKNGHTGKGKDFGENFLHEMLLDKLSEEYDRLDFYPDRDYVIESLEDRGEEITESAIEDEANTIMQMEAENFIPDALSNAMYTEIPDYTFEGANNLRVYDFSGIPELGGERFAAQNTNNGYLTWHTSLEDAEQYLREEYPESLDGPTSFHKGYTEHGGSEYRENKHYWDNAPEDVAYYGPSAHEFKLKNIVAFTRTKIRESGQFKVDLDYDSRGGLFIKNLDRAEEILGSNNRLITSIKNRITLAQDIMLVAVSFEETKPEADVLLSEAGSRKDAETELKFIIETIRERETFEPKNESQRLFAKWVLDTEEAMRREIVDTQEDSFTENTRNLLFNKLWVAAEYLAVRHNVAYENMNHFHIAPTIRDSVASYVADNVAPLMISINRDVRRKAVGERYYTLEEMQSDWVKDGRKFGWVGENNDNELAEVEERLADNLRRQSAHIREEITYALENASSFNANIHETKSGETTYARYMMHSTTRGGNKITFTGSKEIIPGQATPKNFTEWLSLKKALAGEYIGVDVIGDSKIKGGAATSASASVAANYRAAISQFENISRLVLADKNLLSEKNLIEHDMRELSAKTFKVPKMPMRSNWHEMAFRMSLRDTINQGIENLAWSTGAIQTARWEGTTEEIEAIDYAKTADGRWTLTIVSIGGNETSHDVHDSELRDYVGGELEAKIRNTESGTIESDEVKLVVPAAYFRNLYDKKLVNYANKLLKGHSAEVTKVELDGVEWWSMPIPDTLRNQFLDEGIPLFDAEQQEQMHPPQVKGLEGAKRGVWLENSRRMGLSEIANPSTIPHELGHKFIIALVNLALAGDKQATYDVNHMINWLGAADINDLVFHPDDTEEQHAIKVSLHEKLANGYVVYLQEGKAPTPELESVFERFREWLAETVEALVNRFGIQLNDEMREVYARFHIVDAQVMSAADVISAHKMTKEQLRMSDEQYARYEKYIEGAIVQARKAMDKKLVERANAKKSAKYKEVERAIRAEVTAQLEQVNLHRLRARFGNRDDDLKLDSAAVAEVLKGRGSAGEIRKLVGYALRKEGGQDPAQVAQAFGYSSAYDMLADVAFGRKLQQEIDYFTDKRMEQEAEERDDIALPSDISTSEAQAAIRNADYESALVAEISALEALTGRTRSFPVKTLKANAARFVGRMRAGDLNPQAFITKERMAAARALKAAQAGDSVTALEEKSKQLLHQYMAKEAFKRLEKQEKTLKQLRRLDTTAGRQGIDSAFLPHILSVLQRFDLRAKPQRDVAVPNARETRQYLEELEANGDVFLRVSDDSLLYSDIKTPWKQLTVEQLDELGETMKHVVAIGKKVNTIRPDGETIQLSEAVEPVRTNLRENIKQRIREVPEKGLGATLLNMWAELRKRRNVARRIDDFKDNGAAERFLIRPITKAQGAEEKRLGKEFDFLNKFFNQYGLNSNNLRKDKRAFAGGELHLTTEQILMFALNYGNEENKRRGLETLAFYLRDQSEEYTHAQTVHREVIAAVTDEQWTMVQEMWDYLETFWEEVSRLEFRTTGVIPKKVEHVAFTTPTGRQMRGGYFPIAYEPMANPRTNDLNIQEQANQSKAAYGAAAMTRHGHTKERVGSGGQVLKLDLSVMFRHIQDVVHDLTHREALNAVHKTVKALQPDMVDRLGVQDFQQWQKWLNRIAVGDQPAATEFERVVGVMRGRVTVMGLGLNFSTAALQLMGLTQSVEKIGARWVAAATGQYMASRSNPRAWRQAINEKSHVMESRGETFNRDVRELQKQLHKNKKLTQWESFMFAPIVAMQSVIDGITWTAAYNKAIHEGNSEEDAINLADADVILTQSSGRIADLSGVEGGNPFLKLFTTFYSFFNTLLNLGADRYIQLWNDSDAGTINRVGNALRTAMLLYVIPALVTSFILDIFVAGDEPEEPEEWGKWVFDEMSGYLAGQMPFVRDVVPNGYRYSGPAGLRSFEVIYKAIESGYDLLPGGDPFGGKDAPGLSDDPIAALNTGDSRAIIDAAALLAPIPSGAVKRFIDNLHRIQEGETEGAFDMATGFVTRKARN